jgi:tRNA(adenine34) deaminase
MSYFMKKALQLAEYAQQQGEVPVGAVLVKDGSIVGEGFNYSITRCDPTAHAEIQAIRHAAQTIGNYRLVDTTLYVTLEPCAMCAGAIVQARIKHVVFGAYDPKAGACGSVFSLLGSPLLNHRPTIEAGVCAPECGKILSDFFRERRSNYVTSDR